MLATPTLGAMNIINMEFYLNHSWNFWLLLVHLHIGLKFKVHLSVSHLVYSGTLVPMVSISREEALTNYSYFLTYYSILLFSNLLPTILVESIILYLPPIILNSG